MTEFVVIKDFMNIYLYGPPGSGKSSVGKILAGNLNLPFFDLDQKIEELSKLSIPEIFSASGEAAFREIERNTLELSLIHI